MEVRALRGNLGKNGALPRLHDPFHYKNSADSHTNTTYNQFNK